MAGKTKIEWTRGDDGSLGATWNPVVGCSLVSPGCTNCYAMRTAARFNHSPFSPYLGLTKTVNGKPVWTGEVGFNPKALEAPLHWKKPRRIFVNSMGDLFHESVPDEWIDKVFAVMALAPQHTFQVLTKRADRMRDYLSDGALNGRIACASVDAHLPDELLRRPSIPLPNVWLGVSAEDQERADERIPLLLDTPAAVRFVSVEPQLGPVDLSRLEIARFRHDGEVAVPRKIGDVPAAYVNGLDGSVWGKVEADENYARVLGADVGKLSWTIIGGESGPGARPFDLTWARSIIAQCKAAEVACFVKQCGSRPVDSNGGEVAYGPILLRDKKGGIMSEWPHDLQIRQFPNAGVV